MAPTFSFLISSVSKKNEPRYECLSEARTSHAHRTLTEVSSLVSNFLQMGLLPRPMSLQGVISSEKTNDKPGLEYRSVCTVSCLFNEQLSKCQLLKVSSDV